MAAVAAAGGGAVAIPAATGALVPAGPARPTDSIVSDPIGVGPITINPAGACALTHVHCMITVVFKCVYVVTSLRLLLPLVEAITPHLGHLHSSQCVICCVFCLPCLPVLPAAPSLALHFHWSSCTTPAKPHAVYAACCTCHHCLLTTLCRHHRQVSIHMVSQQTIQQPGQKHGAQPPSDYRHRHSCIRTYSH